MNNRQTLFASGCALRKYKPELIKKMTAFLAESGIVDGTYETCCKSRQAFSDPVTLVTCCPWCDHAFAAHRPTVSTVSLWKALLNTDFPFPNYHHESMSIHDACHRRGRSSKEMQLAVRALCERMNIDLIEPVNTLDESKCCGGCAANLADRIVMARERAKDFPAENVVVYCTGCTRSLSVTDAHPRHILDLLYMEATEGLTLEG